MSGLSRGICDHVPFGDPLQGYHTDGAPLRSSTVQVTALLHPLTLEWALPDNVHGQGSFLSKEDSLFYDAIGQTNVICISLSSIKDPCGIFMSRLNSCEHLLDGEGQGAWDCSGCEVPSAARDQGGTGPHTVVPLSIAEPAVLSVV